MAQCSISTHACKMQLLLDKHQNMDGIGMETGVTVTCTPSSVPFLPSSFQEGCPPRCYITIVMPCMIQRSLLCHEWTLLWYVLRYNGPYGHLGLIGYLGVDTQ
jgi:hypothetical protein